MPANEELDPRRWRALAVCVTALFMTLLDVSIVNVALPSITKGTGASPSEIQWVVSGYALAFGMVPIIAGRLGDDRGRRRLLLIGIAAFVATSALVGFAPTAGVLVAGRVLQGFAGGLINPQVSGLVQQLFPLRERGRAFGVIGTAVGLATAAGPVVGGAIISVGGDQIGWRLTFLLNVPVGITSFVLCRAWLPRTARREGPPRPLDLRGAALLTVGMFAVLFPAVEYDSDHDVRLALLWVPAALLLTGFVLWERGPARRGGHPLIDTRLFRIRSYADGLGLALLYFCAYTGTPLVLALFLQEGLGYSPLESGLTASAFAVGAGFAAPIAGRLVTRMGRTLIMIAIGVFAVGVGGAAATVFVASHSASPTQLGWLLAPFLLLAGLGGGGVITPNQALSLAEIDSRGGSTAGGMLQTAQRIGSAIGSATISAVFYYRATGKSGLHGQDRYHAYGLAYSSALLLALAFAALALALAVRDVRMARVNTSARSA